MSSGIQTQIGILVALAVSLLPGTARPQDATDAGFESIVVGKRIPETAFESDRSVTVLDEKTLDEASPRTVPEALWDSPGTFIQQTNHGGGSPILRGMIGPQVLILVDGVRLNNSTYRTGPVQYLNLVEPTLLDRIEVLRGPGSVLYGSDAMGGVIQLTPIGPRDYSDSEDVSGSGNLLMRFGSAGLERTLHGHADMGTGGFSSIGGVTLKWLGDLRGGGAVDQQPYTGYEQWSATAGLVYQVPEGSVRGLTVSARYLYTRIDDAGRTDKLYDKRSLQVYDNEDHLAWVRLAVPIRSIMTDAALTLSYQDFFERKDNYSMAEDLHARLSDTRDEVRVHTLGTDLQLVTRVLDDRLRFQWGGTWYRDWVGADRMKQAGDEPFADMDDKAYPDGSTYDTYGAFLQVEGDPLRTNDGHVLRLGAGYRFHGMAGFSQATDTLDEVDFTHQGHVFLGSLQYLLQDKVTIAATFSQGFRAPNLQEAVQLGDTGKYFHVPNDNLGSERSDTVELLARARVWRLEFAAAGYVSFLHDLIKREGTTWQGQDEIGGKEVVHNVNGKDGRLWGVEGGLGVDVGWGLSLHGHVTWTWGEEFVPDEPDVPLTRVPPLYGMAKLRWDTPSSKRFRAFAETYVRWATKQDRLSPEDVNDARIPDGGTPGWWTWNLRGGFRVQDRYRVGLSIENILNRKYKYHASGVWAPGTNVVVSLECDI